MSNTKRRMLIVEDDELWQETNADSCEAVHEKLYGNKGEIIIAANLPEALRVLNETPPDFASVDLNLEGTEYTEDPGGLKVLEEIKTKKLKTISIVMSGENDPYFWGKSIEYRALTFQKKGEEIYEPAVEAALLYIEAIDLLDNKNYNAALKKWSQAKETIVPIQNKKRSIWSFPSDIEDEYRKIFTHRTIELPIGELINDEIRRLFALDEWWLFYIEIKHLDHFIKKEKPSQERLDTLLVKTKELLEEYFVKQISREIFLGLTIDNIFVLTLTASSLSEKKIKELVTNVKESFDKDEPSKYYSIKNLEEITNEDMMMTLAVGFAKGEKRNFSVGKLSLGQVKYESPFYGDPDSIDEAMREEALQFD